VNQAGSCSQFRHNVGEKRVKLIAIARPLNSFNSSNRSKRGRVSLKKEQILVNFQGERIMSKDDSNFVISDGLRFRVKASSNLQDSSQKPIVVLFHGASFSLDDWKRNGTFAELSSRSVPFLAVDLPRGKASKSQKKELPDMKSYVTLLENLFRASGIDLIKSKLLIIGPSMGGAFALEYALERPNQILGLVLISPSLSGLNRTALEELTVPVLLVWGDRDNVFPLEQNGRELKQILPNSKLLIIKGAGHPAYLDRPSEFHDLLFDFLDELSG
jgi:abhydrolase domain-containing protein 14